MAVPEIHTLTDLLVAVNIRRATLQQVRVGLVSSASQAAKVIREAHQFAEPATPGAGQPARDSVLKDMQAIGTALQTIDLHLSRIAATARMTATTVDEAEARRKHTASTYRV
jgi:hypothetical protein